MVFVCNCENRQVKTGLKDIRGGEIIGFTFVKFFSSAS